MKILTKDLKIQAYDYGKQLCEKDVEVSKRDVIIARCQTKLIQKDHLIEKQQTIIANNDPITAKLTRGFDMLEKLEKNIFR